MGQYSVKSVNKFLIFQFSLVAVMTIAGWIWLGRHAALSLGSGGLVSFIPNWVFSFLLFRHWGAQAAKKIVMSLFLGEALKLFIAIALFVAVFQFGEVLPGTFFIGFIVTQATVWLTPWLIK